MVGLVITLFLDIYIFARGSERSIHGSLHILASPATRSGPFSWNTPKLKKRMKQKPKFIGTSPPGVVPGGTTSSRFGATQVGVLSIPARAGRSPAPTPHPAAQNPNSSVDCTLCRVVHRELGSQHRYFSTFHQGVKYFYMSHRDQRFLNEAALVLTYSVCGAPGADLHYGRSTCW